jgi:hypothetical protein
MRVRESITNGKVFVLSKSTHVSGETESNPLLHLYTYT